MCHMLNIILGITLHINLTHLDINTHTTAFSQRLKRRQALEHISRQRRDLVGRQTPAQTQAGRGLSQWRLPFACSQCHATAALSHTQQKHQKLYTSNDM
jgi:hypothetical protein